MKMALKQSLYKRYALMAMLCLALASHMDLGAADNAALSSATFASEEDKKTKAIAVQIGKANEKSRGGTFKTSYKLGENFEQKFEVKLEKKEIDLFKEYNKAKEQTEGGLPEGEVEARKAKQEELADQIRDKCKETYEDSKETNDPSIDDVEIDDLKGKCKNSAKVTQHTLKYKKSGCSSCDWNAVDESFMTGSFAEMAAALLEGLDEQGRKEYDKYQEEQKKKARQNACKEDSKGRDLLHPRQSEKRMVCLWDKKVLTERKMSDKIDAYNEHIHHRLEAMVHSLDPMMRTQSKNLIHRFYHRSRKFSDDSLAAKLDAMMLQQQTMTGLFNLATRCGVPQSGHRVGVHGFNNTACLMTGVRRIQVDLRNKSHNMARHYRSVNRQSAQALSTYMHQRFGNEFNDLLQNPVQFMSLRTHGIYNNLGNLGTLTPAPRSSRPMPSLNKRPIRHTGVSPGGWSNRMPEVTRSQPQRPSARRPAPQQRISRPGPAPRRSVFRRSSR